MGEEEQKDWERHFENVKFLIDRFIEYSKKATEIDFSPGSVLPRGLMLPTQDYTSIAMDFIALGAQTFVNMHKECNSEGLSEYLMELGTVREVFLKSMDASAKDEEDEEK